MSSYVTRGDRKDLVVADTTYGEEAAKQVEYQLVGGGMVRIISFPDLVDSVVSLTAIASLSEGGYRDIVESTPKDWGDRNWFPERVDYRREFDEKIVEREVLTISEASFNQPIDPIIFAPEGLELPAGTGVLDHPRHADGGRVFDGTKLTVRKNPAAELPPVSISNEGRWRWVVGGNLLLLGVILGLVAIQQWRRRTTELQ